MVKQIYYNPAAKKWRTQDPVRTSHTKMADTNNRGTLMGKKPLAKHNQSKLSQWQIKAETACAQQCARKHPPQAAPGEHQQTSPDGPDSRTSRQDYSHPGRALAEQVYLAIWQMTGQSPCQTHL